MTFAIGFLCFEYFGNLSILSVTVMSTERWPHMARQSLVNVHRARVILAVLLLVPIPLVVHRLTSGFSFSYKNYVANFHFSWFVSFLIHLGLLVLHLRNDGFIKLSFNMIAVLIFLSSSLNPLLYL